MSKKIFSFDARDYAFMRSLSAAVLEENPKQFRWVIFFWVFSVTLFLIWASFSPIDEIVRGEGKVVPGGENQMIQHLEGGILEDILVKEGETVKVDQVLLKVNNLKSASTYESMGYKAAQLRAKMVRLKAEITNTAFMPSPEDMKEIPEQILQERNLFTSNRERLNAQLSGLNEQYVQKKNDKLETQGRITEQKKALSYIKEEVRISAPLVEQGVKSKVDFLKLQRELSTLEERCNGMIASMPRLDAAISEIENKMQEVRSEFTTKAQLELNDAQTEFNRITAESASYADQVVRTTIKSPINGVVQKIYVNTIGGVIKPGDNLIEIVPTEDGLLAEVKVKPSDIAFLYPGQEAIVKVTAYDFAIYGSLKGKVVTISPDSMTDKRDNTYYIVRVQTDKKYFGTEAKPLNITPGMTLNVDIITGKKTVMQYILKPILKAKQYMFTER
ncbi:HlyD family type I secretion periplasmic adaptor subunit [Sulfurospirillum diekertiae]|uniref:HlyD family type I secretion periplasmic adaptor subunit n=1 Tax=Sulfurospirillum diekertiae TaxID=1854492 RepID=A0A6G9VTX8_9BACT|nr:HlyD family type I secretion periplasmic adaptor subunit [Sulfurospirillum diekertiae]QIR76840.1 HlyD family type I secretion periplasmic adaptor subunit [Sulfurospirillum diekertiae]QIR79459.1 HlyD family type I secretion periplasmic adaptor subunit [Sulfurospirillum diekertiae]